MQNPLSDPRQYCGQSIPLNSYNIFVQRLQDLTSHLQNVFWFNCNKSRYSQTRQHSLLFEWQTHAMDYMTFQCMKEAFSHCIVPTSAVYCARLRDILLIQLFVNNIALKARLQY